MDQYYSAFLKRFDKLEGSKKIVTICGALVATGLATYCLKRVFIGGNGFSTKEKGGEEAIPTPEGAVYYLGRYKYVANLVLIFIDLSIFF
jgi:hypothetical protein